MIRAGIGCCGWIVAMILAVVVYRMVAGDGAASSVAVTVPHLDTTGLMAQVTTWVNAAAAWLAQVVLQILAASSAVQK